MRKLTLLSVVALGIGAMAQVASAADLPVRQPPPPYKAPPPIRVFSWTGCYIGGNIGGLWANREWDDAGIFPGDPFVGQAFGTHNISSWIGGGQVGCDYQFAGGFVVGIQGDYDLTNATGSSVNALVPIFTNQTHIKSLASVTGRIGYAWDRILGYVKGGGAWESADYNGLVTATGTLASTASATFSGWTVGIGGEYAFTDWLSGFVEYDYYNFGSNQSVSLVTTPGGVTVPITVKATDNVFKAGLNLRWGWGGPVVARY
jgi:outer membrane immunogenic protein